VATGDSALELVVQWPTGAGRDGRRAIARRLRLGRDLARVAPWLPLPEVLGGSSCGPAPYLVLRFVSGTSGRDLLGDDIGAAHLGAAMGCTSRDIARIPTAGLRLSRTWSEPDLLRAAGRRWLEIAGRVIDPALARRIEVVLSALPGAFEGARPVFAHGDLAPVNVLMREGKVAGLLDLERARLAHPLFDAAWWRWIIRYHHPSRWSAAGREFASAAGLDVDAHTLARLNMLAVVQSLEMVATTPQGRREARREWAARLAQTLEWHDQETG
jgi:aminoglycoside phosphotransferase (APT) family kinase protein